MIKEEYKHSDITARVIGCAMKVHQRMRNGYQEIIYQRCLCIEFDKEGIKYHKEKE